MSSSAPPFKLLVLDVDGTLTDGGMYVLESGEQFKRFNAKDGLGISQAIRRGLTVGIISHSSTSGAIRQRVSTLGIQRFYVGKQSKLEVLQGWCADLGIGLDEVAFIGDDLNDLEIAQAVGLSACPADAVEAMRESCHIVLEKDGGHGCVREFIDRFYAENPATIG